MRLFEELKSRLSIFRSLRFWFTLMMLLIGIVPTIIAASMVVRGYKSRAVALRTSSVKNQCEMLCNSILQSGYLDNPSGAETIDRELMTLSNVYNGRLLIVNSDYQVIRDTFDLDSGKTSVSEEVINCFKNGANTVEYNDANAYIEIVTPIARAGSRVVRGVLVASVSTNEIVQNVEYLENRVLLVAVIVSLVVLFIGFFLAKALVKPFTDVTRAIEDVTDGIEDEAISVPVYIETEQITDAFNRMLSRVRALDRSRSEFVSNVSHELKTPLTSMKVLADSLNGMDDVPVEIYREFMSDITQEIDRESAIITDLLSMVRLDRKAAKLSMETREIGELIAEVIKRLKPIADARGIELVFDMARPVEAEVDVTKIQLAFTNLIENGIKYNVDDGWVRVTLKSDHKYYYVNVADSGLGIPEEELERVFERFYRGDKSHSTAIEGTGLGLAITKSVIALHRGIVKVESKVGEGTTFMVRLPLHPEV
ncbi:MAG: HAMP domain-containing histidine kinase [Lachnospiraceae bacterium]|nr:HAMP domain-containing histidine kinase [Lachnospiraceae bacterium]